MASHTQLNNITRLNLITLKQTSWLLFYSLIAVQSELNSCYSLKDFFRKSDVNNSGDLDKAEFINYLREHEKQLHIVFSTLDENKDGKPTLESSPDVL